MAAIFLQVMPAGMVAVLSLLMVLRYGHRALTTQWELNRELSLPNESGANSSHHPRRAGHRALTTQWQRGTELSIPNKSGAATRPLPIVPHFNIPRFYHIVLAIMFIVCFLIFRSSNILMAQLAMQEYGMFKRRKKLTFGSILSPNVLKVPYCTKIISFLLNC